MTQYDYKAEVDYDFVQISKRPSQYQYYVLNIIKNNHLIKIHGIGKIIVVI